MKKNKVKCVIAFFRKDVYISELNKINESFHCIGKLEYFLQ
jgi:hypothetical protein